MVEQANQQRENDSINLLEYWRVIWNRKILLGIIFGGSAVFAFILCLLSDRIYESTTAIISPESGVGSSLLSSLGSAADLAKIAGISTPSAAPNSDLLVSVLKSWTIRENIVKQFNLINYYHRTKIFNLIPFKRLEYIEDAVKYLEKVTNIEITDEGVISLTVEDKKPHMSADIANAYVENLGQIVTQLGTGAAGRQRRFISEQLAKTEKNLKISEEVLKQYQERHRTVSLENQAKGAIEAAAYLKGEIMASEVQLEVMQSYAKDSHPEVIKLKEKINELKRQLAKSQYSEGLDLPPPKGDAGHFQKEFYLPVANVPEVGLELVRLTRDVKVQEALYTLLIQQLEQAKIDEVKDTPVFQVLDRAVPPERKSKPKTIIVTAMTGFMGIFLGIFVVFLLEYIDKQRQNLGQTRCR